MSAVKNLEALIKIESDLKSKYETKLNTQLATIEEGVKKQEELQQRIDKQHEKISELATATSDSKRIEQVNRELNNRADKLQEEIDSQKKRIKAMRKELTEERAEVKKLKQFDADKLKKNLVANKKKLAEKSTAADLLQKSLNKTRTENAEYQREIEELKAELEKIQPAEEAEIKEDIKEESNSKEEESVATAA